VHLFQELPQRRRVRTQPVITMSALFDTVSAQLQGDETTVAACGSEVSGRLTGEESGSKKAYASEPPLHQLEPSHQEEPRLKRI
jgi:hypothetical protein